MPDEYMEFLRQSALSKKSKHNKWIICYSDDGTKYFFNESTREISWDEPADYVEPYATATNGNS